jgi:hypothetical protein
VGGVEKQFTCAFNDDDFDEMMGDVDGEASAYLVEPGRDFTCHSNNLRAVTERMTAFQPMAGGLMINPIHNEIQVSQQCSQWSFHPLNRQAESLKNQTQLAKSMKRINTVD